MTKPYSEMSAAERLASRIAKNREIEEHVKQNQRAAGAPTDVAGKQKAMGNVLEEFQRIKKERGIDAASDFVRGRSK
jgi:hypothetical protein